MAEAQLAPAIQVTIHEMIRHDILLGHQLMTLLAFPHPKIAVFHLLDYYTHFTYFDGAAISSFAQYHCINKSNLRLL